VIYDTALENLDIDGDGLTGLQEIASGTSPTDADTDGDGIPDGAEAPADRLVPASIPLGALTSNIFVWSPTE
jgi:hypothetical protein